MRQSKQIKMISLFLAIIIAVVSTIMLLGIQLNFSQEEKSVKIGAPIILLCLVGVLFIFKIISKQKKTSILVKLQEKDGKKVGPYKTIFFSYFDYMLFCGIFSVAFSIFSGVFNGIYNSIRFNWITSWGWTFGRLAIVFAIYILCLLIYTIGQIIAYTLFTSLMVKPC